MYSTTRLWCHLPSLSIKQISMQMENKFRHVNPFFLLLLTHQIDFHYACFPFSYQSNLIFISISARCMCTSFLFFHSLWAVDFICFKEFIKPRLLWRANEGGSLRWEKSTQLWFFVWNFSNEIWHFNKSFYRKIISIVKVCGKPKMNPSKNIQETISAVLKVSIWF